MLAVFIVLVSGFSLWQTWVAAGREAKSAGHIEELGNQLKRNEKASERRARQQSESFQGTVNELYRRLSDLQTKVNTDPLLRQNAALLKEIQDIHLQVNAAKARLEQPFEQAELVATFSDSPDHPLQREITVPRQSDGTVEFMINVVNNSKVQAKKGAIFVRLCEDCSFAKEPERFKKAVGALDYDRYMNLDHLDAGVAISIPLKAKPPIFSSRFEVDVTPRCENCVVNGPNKLFVNIR